MIRYDAGPLATDWQQLVGPKRDSEDRHLFNPPLEGLTLDTTPVIAGTRSGLRQKVNGCKDSSASRSFI
jgi:hypothetical protein